MATTTNMSLIKWDLGTDTFDYTQLADNFDKIDAHDHSSGKGVQIDTAGIKASAVNTLQIADSSVTTAKIANSTGASDGVTTAKIATGAVTSAKTDATVVAPYQSSGTAIPSASDNKQFWTTVNGKYVTNSGTTTIPSAWKFRYSSADTKWYFTGGAPLVGIDQTSGGSVTTSYAAITNTAITLPYKGTYLLTYTAEFLVSTGSNNQFILAAEESSWGGSSPTGSTSVLLPNGGGAGYGTATTSKIVSITSSKTYEAFVKVSATTGTTAYGNAVLSAVPIYIEN